MLQAGLGSQKVTVTQTVEQVHPHIAECLWARRWTLRDLNSLHGSYTTIVVSWTFPLWPMKSFRFGMQFYIYLYVYLKNKTGSLYSLTAEFFPFIFPFDEEVLHGWLSVNTLINQVSKVAVKGIMNPHQNSTILEKIKSKWKWSSWKIAKQILKFSIRSIKQKKYKNI